MTDGKAAELGFAHFEVARAPADDLYLFFFFDRLGERGWFQSRPELFVRAGDDGEVGGIISPLDPGAPPGAASAFLQAHQRAVVQPIGGGEDFARADEEAGFDDRLHMLGPGLEIIILLAMDLDADQFALPIARRLLRGLAAKAGPGAKQQKNCEATDKSNVHSRRSLGTP